MILKLSHYFAAPEGGGGGKKKGKSSAFQTISSVHRVSVPYNYLKMKSIENSLYFEISHSFCFFVKQEIVEIL